MGRHRTEVEFALTDPAALGSIPDMSEFYSAEVDQQHCSSSRVNSAQSLTVDWTDIVLASGMSVPQKSLHN